MPIRMQKPMVRTANLAIARTSPKQADRELGTSAHRRWREEVLKRAHHKCQGEGPHSPGSLIADHIKERRDGGALYDVNNGQALCPACHGRKTNRERARRQRGEQTTTTQQRDACGPLVSHPRGEGESNP